MIAIRTTYVHAGCTVTVDHLPNTLNRYTATVHGMRWSGATSGTTHAEALREIQMLIEERQGQR